MLLKMNLVYRPQIDAAVLHERLEFFLCSR
jgi:hypothetical protein